MRFKSAEEAAHARAAAVVSGDFGVAVSLMTPEALTTAMQLGVSGWDYGSYELKAQDQDDDDYLFEITYHSPTGALTLRDRFRNLDGEWKIVDIERLG